MSIVPRILITGGAGFVGSTIALELLAAHPTWHIVVLDVNERSFNDERIKCIRGDVRQKPDCMHAVRHAHPTLIVHAAGVVPGGLKRYGHRGRDQVLELNVGGTVNMLDAAKECGVKYFLFTGSCTSITDDLEHDYHNFREELPFPQKALIYGESKVGLIISTH